MLITIVVSAATPMPCEYVFPPSVSAVPWTLVFTLIGFPLTVIGAALTRTVGVAGGATCSSARAQSASSAELFVAPM